MTNDIEKKEDVSIILSDEKIALQVNEKIGEAIDGIMGRLSEDRTEAQDLFNELKELFLMGETDPHFISELNKAQENIQGNTENLIKVLTVLSRLKSGNDKIKAAAIQNNNNNNMPTKAEIIDVLEMMERENQKEE